MNRCSTPVYAVRFETKVGDSPGEIFSSFAEASKFLKSPDIKGQGPRFKKFDNPEEAEEYLHQPYVTSPLATSSRTVINEPTIPSPSLKITDYTVLKKVISDPHGDVSKFCELVEENPRYLINTSGDTASILMAGMRYNALHIAAQNAHRGAFFVDKIIAYITDVNYIMKCYGTDEYDAAWRMENIAKSILNTGDKNGDTPLHIASKFGHVDVVRALLVTPLTDKNAINYEKKTPLGVVCSRYKGYDKVRSKEEIELILNGYYVALYRASDNTGPRKLIITENIPDKWLDKLSSTSINDNYQLAAQAGPFYDRIDAEEFRMRWNQTGREEKLKNLDKGYELVGRQLAYKHEPRVVWAETWFFLPNNGLLDLMNREHLVLLNNYLNTLRIKGQYNEAGDFLADDHVEEYVDALDDFSFNSSLGDLADFMAKLSLNSPRQMRGDSQDNDLFITPPSTPQPVYLLGTPTKSDTDLCTALSLVPTALLEPFGSIKLFMNKISRMNQEKREEWPSKDSPRIHRIATPRRLQAISK